MTKSKPSLPAHEVIICTRNRADDLRRALVAVVESSHGIDVLVVDSSDNDAAIRVVDDLKSREMSGSRLRAIKSEAGLTLQRNVGLEHTHAKVVHFIDDDTEVFPDYFFRVARLFDDDEVVGAGGVQDHIAPKAPSLLRRLGQIEAKPGRLSPSAVNNLVTQLHDKPVDVDWLSGCCMAFRVDKARLVRFNEDLRGYSLGEDVDFSLRIAKFGRLRIDTSARVHHYLSQVNRSNTRTNVRDTLRHRRRLVGAHPERFSVPAFWWSVSVDAARYGVGVLVGRDLSREAFAGLLEAARDPWGRGS